jgi:6-pyruvoyltetrahydropterin/6-carboxytetrahydropterin synthase
MYELVIEKTIAAAHYLTNYKGSCERLHGHNYRVVVFVRGEELDSAGMLVDFTDLKAALNQVLDRFDHYNLNDLPEFADLSTSAENIARVIADYLTAQDFAPARIDRVQVWETPTQAATYFVPSAGSR